MNITRRPPQGLERQGRTGGYSYQRDWVAALGYFKAVTRQVIQSKEDTCAQEPRFARKSQRPEPRANKSSRRVKPRRLALTPSSLASSRVASRSHRAQPRQAASPRAHTELAR
eukprot:scaffold78565_cov69-Phaeocystis_antarctica.AAC.3